MKITHRTGIILSILFFIYGSEVSAQIHYSTGSHEAVVAYVRKNQAAARHDTGSHQATQITSADDTFRLPVHPPGDLVQSSDQGDYRARPASARSPEFWVVNFGTARTLPPKRIGFAAGIGGQIVFLGDPRLTSAFFTIPHAGVRLGLTKRLDAGLRLAPIPLPFSSVGPGFGMNLDAKYWLTKPESKIDFGLVLGLGGAHVLIEEDNRFGYSPNAALLTTYNLRETMQLTLMGRFVNLVIPTAPGGRDENFVNISGLSLGLKKDIAPRISLLPEIGAYWYDGQIGGRVKNGPGFQYGIMLATSF